MDQKDLKKAINLVFLKDISLSIISEAIKDYSILKNKNPKDLQVREHLIKALHHIECAIHCSEDS